MKTEINLYILFGILFLHWVFDFVFQTGEQAVNKSTSNKYLTVHVLTYTGSWSLCISAYVWFFYVKEVDGVYQMAKGGNSLIIFFPTITFICHWITDYYTSRLNTYLYKKSDFHNFFVSVGFDQLLHYAQLLITFQILS